MVLNGVNLDMLGHRDSTLYGGLSIDELETQIYSWAHALELTARCLHSNHEGQFIEWIHDAHGRSDGMIVNPGAWTHYSYAVHDALEILQIPVVEVHLSNILERKEAWRHTSVIEDVVAHRVLGKGPGGYREALEFFAARRSEP
jgi:3-dehydroquinate dehydratase-2